MIANKIIHATDIPASLHLSAKSDIDFSHYETNAIDNGWWETTYYYYEKEEKPLGTDYIKMSNYLSYPLINDNGDKIEITPEAILKGVNLLLKWANKADATQIKINYLIGEGVNKMVKSDGSSIEAYNIRIDCIMNRDKAIEKGMIDEEDVE